MPLRGESVGSAYVRIYADGSDVPDGIRDALNDAEPSVREAGKKHGETYGEEFDKSVKGSYKKHFETTKGEMFGDLNEELTDSLAKLKLADNFFKSKEWKTFLDRLDNEFGAAGRLAGKKLEEQFRDGANLDRLADEMSKIGPKVRAAQRELLMDLHADALAMNRDYDRAIKARADSWREMLDEAYHDNKAFDREWSKMIADQDKKYELHIKNLRDLDNQRLEDLTRSHSEALRMNKIWDKQQSESINTFRRSLEELTKSVDKFEKGERGVSHSRLTQMIRNLKALAPSLHLGEVEMSRMNRTLAESDRRLREVNPRLDAFDHSIRRVGDRIGKLFGKGSRNDFLNFFGSVVGSITQLPRLLTKPLGLLSNLGQSMSKAFSDSGGGASGFLAALATGGIGVASALGKAAIAGASFVAFIGGLSLIIGPIVAIISGLVGILAALSSSLIFAAASLASFFPLLIPLAALFAGITAAVIGLKDATGPLGRQLSFIGDQAKDLWRNFKDGVTNSVGLGRVLNEVSRSLSQMEPLFDAAVKGFNRFADAVADEMAGGAFDQFTNRFARFLPHAMKDLGEIAANALGGIAGLLRGSVPAANRLLDWLTKITDQFDNWANSREGQREIKRFLDRAGDSAKSFGDFLEGAWDWLTKLINKSKGEGDTLWERIGGKFQEWADYIEAHPDAFEKWMKDADNLATSLGRIADALTRVIDALDTAENRDAGIMFLNALADVLTFTAGATSSFQNDFIIPAKDGLISFGSWLGWFFSTLGKGVWYVIGGQWVDDLMHGIGDGISAAGKWIGKQFSRLWGSISNLGRPGGGGGGMNLQIIDTSAITKQVQRALSALGDLPAGVRRIAGRIGDAFDGVPNRVRNALNGIPGIANTIWNRLPTQVQQAVTGLISRFQRIQAQFGTIASNAVSTAGRWFSGIPDLLNGIPGRIVALFQGLGGRIVAAIGNIDIWPDIHWPSPPGWLSKVTASGGVFAGAQARIIGEAGPEAVVPLNRPLHMVDPAVRWLSAIAQGKGGAESATGTGVGKMIDASGWTVVTPSEDPHIVAVEVLNELAAKIA